MSFLDLVKQHNETIFSNTCLFSERLVLQFGSKSCEVVGVLKSNTVYSNNSKYEYLQQVGWTLIVSTDQFATEVPKWIFNQINVGSSLVVNDKPYMVTGITNELGMTKFKLQKGGAR